jgi:hypothetical protein
MNFNKAKLFHAKFLAVALGAGLFLVTQSFAAEMMQKSGSFKGPKANTGFVTSSIEGGKIVLALSNDFKTRILPIRTGRWLTPRAPSMICRR